MKMSPLQMSKMTRNPGTASVHANRSNGCKLVARLYNTWVLMCYFHYGILTMIRYCADSQSKDPFTSVQIIGLWKTRHWLLLRGCPATSQILLACNGSRPQQWYPLMSHDTEMH